ncbi:MAG TPA: hypothetical protein VHF45_10335 [Thermoleophilaceae bacterium]|nr:hypothetical protein [Thermoleophilaceae bacterium]
MSRRGLLAIVCCTCALGVAPSTANAASVLHQTCTSQVTWSVNLTSATHTFTNVTCYQEDALVTIDGLFPEWQVRGQGTANDPGSYSGTLGYTPLLGLCLGTLQHDSPTSTATGAYKNDGTQPAAAKFVARSKSNPHVVMTVTTAGALQPSCSSGWSGTAVTELAIAQQ